MAAGLTGRGMARPRPGRAAVARYRDGGVGWRARIETGTVTASTGPESSGIDSDGQVGGDRAGRVSPAARLCAFLLLLALVFAAAFLVGTRLGPLTTGHGAPSHGQPMNMGLGAAGDR
jgi:hypothetical protein